MSLAKTNARRPARELSSINCSLWSFPQTSTAAQLGSTLWIAFVADAAYPWRLVETERSTTGRLRRKQMLCFALLEEILRAIEERLAWATADEQFCARHHVLALTDTDRRGACLSAAR